MKAEAYDWPNEIKPPIRFANSQWAVTSYGLECLTSYYPIEAARLTETRPGTRDMYDWPPHMAEKEWVNVPAFIEAFGQALRIHIEGHPVSEAWVAAVREAETVAAER
jgi:hypothetical protein